MDSQSRLERALGASAGPLRDPAFTLAVLKAAEVERFRAEAAFSMLRAGGLAALGGAGLLLVADWASADWDAVQSGLLLAAGSLALVGLMIRRLHTALAR